jgi:hypothetical protein
LFGGVLVGNYGRRKHPSEKRNKSSLYGGSQSTLPYPTKPMISRSDAKDYLIPVLKEVGKAVFPAAAPLIETAYQVYKHYDAIKEVTSAVSKGDYEQAAKIGVKEIAKEAVGAGVSEKLTPLVNTSAETAKTEIANSLPIDNQAKDIAGKIIEGSIKGGCEAVEDKIVDKVIQKVVPN